MICHYIYQYFLISDLLYNTAPITYYKNLNYYWKKFYFVYEWNKIQNIHFYSSCSFNHNQWTWLHFSIWYLYIVLIFFYYPTIWNIYRIKYLLYCKILILYLFNFIVFKHLLLNISFHCVIYLFLVKYVCQNLYLY